MNQKIKIYKPPRIDWIPIMIDKFCKANNINSEIVTDIDESDSSLYIILCHQRLNKFPKKYIIYQLEQIGRSPYITKQYNDVMDKALNVLDYSELNIKNKTTYNNVIYQPILVNSEVKTQSNYQYDILFYGTMNKRRIMIIKFIQIMLGKKYRVKIIDGLFGNELFEHVSKAKIVLNIHYFTSAILETTRLNELLQYDNIVISELPCTEDKSYLDYDGVVIFTEEIRQDMSNINSLIILIEKCLINFEKRDIEKRKQQLLKMENIAACKFISFFNSVLN